MVEVVQIRGIPVEAYLTPSQIGTIDKCGAQFVLERAFPKDFQHGYFILGTAVHEAIEHAIHDGLGMEGMFAHAEVVIAREIEEWGAKIKWQAKLAAPGSEKYAVNDIARHCLENWFIAVHPASPNRMDFYKEWAWPPMTEAYISRKEDPDFPYKIGIDAVFKHKTKGLVAVVDWKTGGKYELTPWQLQMAWWALRREGIVDRRQKIRAWYHHLRPQDAGGRVQAVDFYPGDNVIEHRLYAKEQAKKRKLLVPDQGWWCKACRVQPECPVWHKGKQEQYDDILDRIEFVTDMRREQDEPEEE